MEPAVADLSVVKATQNATGVPSKQPLVLVHGYLGGGSQWADQVDYFSPYFEVVTLDLPGFGGDPDAQAPDSIQGLAENLLSQLDHRGIERFHLLGHSMGGMIVQEMARLAPQRIDRLVLYGTGPIGLMPGRFETIDQSRQCLQNDGVAATGRRIAETWFLDGKVASGYSVCAEIATKSTTQAALAGLTAMENWSGVAALEKIAAPTLVLWGDQDRAYLWQQPEQLWRTIPNAQLAVIAGCSHAVHLEKASLFNATLLDFLRSGIE